jgi:hypothetical protein
MSYPDIGAKLSMPRIAYGVERVRGAIYISKIYI